ncbi:MAG: sugar phosphate isomerase/epimerase [Clostridia bacterium]|nr:sugar phosphate isomerase/epimerase [Clostridia bacterium]
MKICVQSQDLIDQFGFEDGYRMIREAGFEGIDWNIDHAWRFGELLKAERLENLCIFEQSQEDILAYYREELEAIRKNGLAISQAHAPFGAYDPARPEILDYAIEIYKSIIRFCGTVGCPRLIIHGITHQPRYQNVTPAECNALNHKLYESLIPTLQEVKSVTVCLENCPGWSTFGGYTNFWSGYCCDPHEATAEIDRYNEKAGVPCFGFCLDTGHLHLTRIFFHSYLSVLGNRVCALHVHDNVQTRDSHLMPYTGSIDWKEFTDALRDIGYTGDISFETFAQTTTERLPRELVPVFLGTVAQIGCYFRKQLK